MKKVFCQYCGGVTHKIEVDARVRDVCSQCRKTAYHNPIPSTAVVILNDKNQFLMVKRTVEPQIGMWCLPGGFLETDETPMGGALRELREETGLIGTDPVLLDVQKTHSIFYESITIIGYLVRHWSGIEVAGDDAGEVAWYDFDEHPEIAFEPHKSFVQQVRKTL